MDLLLACFGRIDNANRCCSSGVDASPMVAITAIFEGYVGLLPVLKEIDMEGLVITCMFVVLVAWILE